MVPGEASPPVGLGHQPTGTLFVPYGEWAATNDERPLTPHGPPVPPPREPAGDGPAENSPAQTRPADVTPADARPADTGPGEAAPADAVPPARPPGAAPATRPTGGPPVRRPAEEPSWGTVLATTFRLWLHRRLEKPWWRVLAVLLVAAIVFGAGAVTIALTRTSPAGGSAGSPASGSASSGRGSGTGVPGSSGGALASVTAARKQVAAWVAQQVNPDEIIGCDPMMCAALEAAHIQANRLLMLGPSEPDPLGSEILLDTATLRSQFGGRLESVYAPVSLAAFGSGAARVEVRVSAPDGAQVYLAQLADDVAARKLAGAQMLRNAAIHASPAARRQLRAGHVDTRLLVTLVTMAHAHPVDILSFGANPAGASPGVPLRSAEIAGAPGPGRTPAASIQTLRGFLSAQQTPYRPSIVVVQTASGRTVLRVGYPAPSPLGLLGTHG